MKKLLILIIVMSMTAKLNLAQEDKFQWLEEVENPKALEWAKGWNDKTLAVLQNQKNYQAIYNKNLEIYNSEERIADPTFYGDYIFNFWQDGQNPRGIWRRTTLKSYLSENTEGGHAGASTNEQRAQMNTLIYIYLQMKLMN